MTLTPSQLQEAIGRSAACGGVRIRVFTDNVPACVKMIQDHAFGDGCSATLHPGLYGCGAEGIWHGRPFNITIHPTEQRAELEAADLEYRVKERGCQPGPLTIRETVALAILGGLCSNGCEVKHPEGRNGLALEAADHFLHLSEIHNGSPFKSVP